MPSDSAIEQIEHQAGKILWNAYFDDQEFRKRRKPIVDRLQELFKDEIPKWFAIVSFDSYLTSSYHAVWAIHMLLSEAWKRHQAGQYVEAGWFMRLQHAFCYEVYNKGPGTGREA